MRYCNFSSVTLQGAVIDGATNVPEMPLIQVTVNPEMGNGLDGNGGADGEVGVVDVQALLLNGKLDTKFFSLTRIVDETNVELLLTWEENVVQQQNSQTVVVTNLFFRPVSSEGELLKLVSLKPYLFSYTSYLPVQWK